LLKPKFLYFSPGVQRARSDLELSHPRAKSQTVTTNIQKYAIQKKAHLSRDLISRSLLLPLTFVTILYQWPDCQNAFDGTVNYNVLDIDGTVASPNSLLYAPETYPTNNEHNDRTLEAKQVLVYTVIVQRLNREYRRDDNRMNIFATERFAVLNA